MHALACALTLTSAALCPPDTLDKEFDTALGVAGLTTSTARFDDGILRFYRQGESPTTLFESCYRDPWRTPFVMDMSRRQLQAASGHPSSSIETLSRLLGQGSRRSLLGDPAAPYVEKAKKADALGTALNDLRKAGVLKGTVPSYGGVPDDVQRAAAAILFCALGTVDFRRAAFASIPDLTGAFSKVVAAFGEPDGPLSEKTQRELGAESDMTYMYAAAQDMASTLSFARTQAELTPPDRKYDFRVDTDWGKIVLTGGSDSVHEGVSTLLVIDTGGNDTYFNAPSNSSIANWCSVTLDTAGNDAYLSDPAMAKTKVSDWTLRGKQSDKSGPGRALFGLVFLLDTKGDDLYRSARPGLGSATFGVAYLGDAGGNDVYDAYADAEGFGHAGVGILDDSEGDDKYSGFTQVQGVGLPRGVGALIDANGNDDYLSNDSVLDFPSAQSADHNNSMSQGAGYGFRADYLTGNSQAGGIGLLYDMAGDDHYLCGVFGQGVGYWEGTGVLWDGSGRDTYQGQWYVQGASAHFGIGYLEDLEGNDTYTAMMNMAQGAGHDFSIGYLIDRDGNDVYKAPNLSLGGGNANGIGVLVDCAGDDTYTSSGLTLGSAAETQKGSMRELALCLGVFMDLGGNDTYPDSTSWAKNGTRTANWNMKLDDPSESQVGVFLDR